MLKKLLLRQWALLLFAALSLQTASTQTFWTETFGSAAAFSAWTSVNGGTGAVQWVRSTDPAVNFGFTSAPKPFKSTTAADGFAFFDSDANKANPHVATLTSAPINCASQTSVRIRFHSQYAAFNQNALAEVRVSSDGGATWTGYQVLSALTGFPVNAGSFVPDDVVTEMALPAANSKPSVLLQFRWTGNFEYGWKIDDIELSNYVAPKVDVTFKVNLSTVTPSPEGARLAGTFNNWTDDLMTNEGNGVWSITKSISVGDTIRYKFKNGSASWEAGQAACGVNDGSGGFNRQFAVKGSITLPTVCFNACGECVVPCSANPANSIICDNIDTYVTTKKLGPQATHWTTWSGTEGTSEDGIVTTEQKFSAPNSVKVLSTTAPGGTGGPQDVVLNLGTKSTGRYSLKWKFFIPANKKAYYNVQDVVPVPPGNVPPENYNLDVFFGLNGKAFGEVEGDSFFFAYPHAQWFTIEHLVDLDNNSMTYLVNDKMVAKFPYADRLGGIDFFGIDNTYLFYIDDVEYVTLPAYVANADICDKAVDLTAYFGQAPSVTQTTPTYDNTTATASPYDPAIDCWAETIGADFVDNSMWFTFVGDGKTYRIETSSTPAGGDTQMAIFEGSDCFNLALSECNDDISANAPQNLSSGIDIETKAGVTYFILVDGFNFLNTVWKGKFALKITRKASLSCAQGKVGTFALDNTGFVCPGVNLSEILTVDGTTFVIPNEGPNYGMLWLLSAEPLDQSVWPDTNLLAAYTSLNENVVEIGLPNNGTTNFPTAVYFLTPIVASGVEKINPDGSLFFNNLNAENGCFFVGESKPFIFLREEDLPEIAATELVTKEVVPPGNNGKIDLKPTGGFPDPTLANDPTLYIFTWAPNGATTEDLSGLAAGTYTVTISDISNCSTPLVRTIVVGKTSGTEDPASVKQLSVSPNPTTGAAQLNLTLANAAEVRIEVVNALGQVLQTLNEGNVSTLSKALDFSSLNAGTYMLRVAVGTEAAVRRIVVQK